MGSNFPRPNRFVVLTFYLISLIFSVNCAQLPSTNETLKQGIGNPNMTIREVVTGVKVAYLEQEGNDVTYGPLANHTVLYVGNMNDKDFSSSTEDGMRTTDLILAIGCVFSVAFFSVVIFAIYRFQVRRKAEYQRAAKAQLSSTRNAGVYMDLAVDTPVSKSSLPISVPIYNSIKKRQDQYTFISDDELDL